MSENLKRTIGVFGLACAVVNITIGTGIFVLPALVAEHLGAAAILCYFICGLLIFLIALCFAEVGSGVTVSGGTYAYIDKAFGPYAGFMANIIFIASCVLSDAAVANALAKTIGFFLPVADTTAFRPVFFLLVFGMLAYINIRGAKNGLRFVVLLTGAKLIPLLLLVAFGAGFVSMENLRWTQAFSFQDIGDAALILFFAFLGLETAVSNGGEIKNPKRVVPMGILSGLTFVLILYISIQLITQGILGMQLNNYKDAPLAAVSNILFGTAGVVIIMIGASVSMLGNLSGEVLALPRVIYAGARDGILPSVLSRIHGKYQTPHLAIIVYVAVGYLLAVFGGFKQLIILTSASTLLIYFGVVISVFQLRRKIPKEERAFTVPGGPIIPLIAAATIIWMLSNLSSTELLGMLATLAGLSVCYMIMQVYKKRKTAMP